LGVTIFLRGNTLKAYALDRTVEKAQNTNNVNKSAPWNNKKKSKVTFSDRPIIT